MIYSSTKSISRIALRLYCLVKGIDDEQCKTFAMLHEKLQHYCGTLYAHCMCVREIKNRNILAKYIFST